MTTVSVEQLHRQTGELVRRATVEDIIVAEGARPLVVLKRYPESAARQQRWLDREHALASLPVLSVDSTVCVSEDRDGR
jgi:hypothetical protein